VTCTPTWSAGARRVTSAFFDLPYENGSPSSRSAPSPTASARRSTPSSSSASAAPHSARSRCSDALLKPHWNELTTSRDYFPRLYVLDNVDPSTIGPLLERLDPRRTLFNVVSKSGATAETMAQFMIVREQAPPVRSTTTATAVTSSSPPTPEKGVLRRIADEEGIATLPVPPGVGGRFSVLSAVGLLPAALAGIDIDALLAGAPPWTSAAAPRPATTPPRCSPPSSTWPTPSMARPSTS
jgi:hypothetical protein